MGDLADLALKGSTLYLKALDFVYKVQDLFPNKKEFPSTNV